MALDDFTSGDSSTSKKEEPKNKRTYKKFDKEEFEECLEGTSLIFKEKDYDWTGELVYEAYSENETFILRVYSSLDKKTGKAREKGDDAIRIVVLHNETERPVLKEKRTNRIQTWCMNLGKKINKVIDKKKDLTFCEECGNLMVIRKNKQSGDKFWGCTSWPDCENTEPIEE